MTDSRWQLLATARPQVVDAFASDGALRVEYVSSFPHEDHFSVWLGTATDAEADRLRLEQGLKHRVKDLLSHTGFTEEQLAGLQVLTLSQESVDRDYAGSWFNALR